MREETRLLISDVAEEPVEESYSKEQLQHGCNHCGGPVRLSLGGYSCMMCGRSIQHSCENCQNLPIVAEPH